MTTDPLADALAELRRQTDDGLCEAAGNENARTILNAVMSGDLMPRSEHLALMAAANEAAAEGIKQHSDVARKELNETYTTGDAKGNETWSAIVAHLDIAHDKLRALTTADQQAALDAMISRAREVKPLVWKDYAEQGFRRADTPIGEYSVGFDDGWWAQLEGVEFWEWEPPEDPRCYSSPEAGMLACKADYTTRILAALADGEPT